MKLYEKHNYLNSKINCISNSIIREYDMRSAGFSLIKLYNLLPQYQIDKIEKMEKLKQNIYIGKLLLGDEELAKQLMEKFIEIRKIFFEANNIDEKYVLAIKKDAIFLVNTTAKVRQFDNVLFVEKNKYSSYINLSGNQFFYNNLSKKFDIKGITNKEHPLIENIKKSLGYIDSGNNEILLEYLQKLREDYLSLKLDVTYYRELNSRNEYKMKDKIINMIFFNDYLSNEDKDSIDISYNYFYFILPLIKLCI